jgi:septal ring factor EnvC (AmiA/AmiB activator)
MDTQTWLILALSCLAACAATWGACQWWFKRRLSELDRKLDKLDKARQLASQQSTQARKQIEKLQTELAAQHRSSVRSQTASQRAQNAERALEAAGGGAATRPTLPPNGFADTQPMSGVGGL